MDGSLEPRLSCPEAVAGGNASASLRPSPRLSLSSGALEEKEAKKSELLTDPTGSLQAWLTILVMPLASLLEMSSGLLPGDSTLTPRRHCEWVDEMVDGWGVVLPGFSCAADCAWRLGCKQPVEGDSGVEAGNGGGGPIWNDVPSSVLSALLVRVSLVPRVQVLSGEGESDTWRWAPTSRGRGPPSGRADTSRLSGSDSSANGAPGCVGTTSPGASSNKPNPTASAAGSTGSKVGSGGPPTHSGGSWG